MPEATPLESERPEYSKTGFVDALVEFVVADDQVCIFHLSIQVFVSNLHSVNQCDRISTT